MQTSNLTDITLNINISIKKKIIILVIIFVLIITGLAIFNFFPCWHQIRVLNQEVLTQKQEVKQLLEIDKSSSSLERNLAQAEEKIFLLHNSLLEKGQEVDFINFLENTALNHNLEQKINLTPPTKDKSKNLNQVSFPYGELNLTLLGSFKNFLKYLRVLEASPYYISINKIDFCSESSSNFSNVFSTHTLKLNRDNLSELSKNQKDDEPNQEIEINLQGIIFWQNNYETS